MQLRKYAGLATFAEGPSSGCSIRVKDGLSEYFHQVDKMQREEDSIPKYTLGAQRVIP